MNKIIVQLRYYNHVFMIWIKREEKKFNVGEEKEAMKFASDALNAALKLGETINVMITNEKEEYDNEE